MIIQKNKRATDFDEIKLDNLYEKYLSGFAKKFKISSGDTRLDDGSKLTGDKSVAVYLNIINPELDYNKLSKKYISCVYIPLRYFMRKDYAKALESITSNFKTYIYMPAIVKTNYKNVLKHELEGLIKQYNIAGFIISSLGDLILLDKYRNKYEFIGNFTLNSFNVSTINNYRNLGIDKITLSPELNIDDINNIVDAEKSHIPLEMIVYGNTPIMKMNYCLLGCANKCYPTCQVRCSTSNKYYLRDRLRI